MQMPFIERKAFKPWLSAIKLFAIQLGLSLLIMVVILLISHYVYAILKNNGLLSLIGYLVGAQAFGQSIVKKYPDFNKKMLQQVVWRNTLINFVANFFVGLALVPGLIQTGSFESKILTMTLILVLFSVLYYFVIYWICWLNVKKMMKHLSKKMNQ